MPRKPPKPCAWQGCPELTYSRHCGRHAKQDAARYNRFDRDPETKRRYGQAWRKARARYIAKNPLCERCQSEGRLAPAQEVHHVKPLAEGGTHDESNLESLCKSCHSRITVGSGQDQDNFFAKPASVSSFWDPGQGYYKAMRDGFNLIMQIINRRGGGRGEENNEFLAMLANRGR